MTAPFTIRPGSLADAAAIAALTVRSWCHAYRGVLPDAVLDARRPGDRLERWRERLALPEREHHTLVCEQDAAMVGYAGVGPASEHSIHPAPLGVGEIYGFYLDPPWFGSGAAEPLMDAVEAWLAPRFTAGWLWVLEDNLRARRFYERRGWQADGARTPYPRPRCPGVYIVRHVRDFSVGGG